MNGVQEDTTQKTSVDVSEEGPVEVTVTRDNVLKLFSDKNSQWSEYYNITLATNEAEERRKNAAPLMSSELKQKLLERKAARRSGGNTLLDTPKVETTQIDTTLAAEPEPVVEQTVADSSDEEKRYRKRNKDELKMDINTSSDDDDETTFIDINEEVYPDAGEATRRFISSIPWQTKPYEGHPGIMLHEEIIDFYNFVKETPEEREQRRLLIVKVTELCNKIDRNCQVSAFGSYPVELMLPGSDLDLYVHSPKYHRNTLGYLRLFTDELRRSKFARKIEFIASARVPIVKFVDIESGQHVDIACNMIGPNGQGAIDIINTYHEQYPAFKYLMLLLKYFVRQRALNEVFTGGVSSYGLSLMVISHLQMHLSNITEKDKRTTSLGTLLLDFFGLYGVYFNYKRIGIDTTEGGSYVPNDDSYDPPAASSYKGLEGTSLMTIDPNDEYNNVTKNCWNFSGVRNAFKYAFSALTSLNHSKTEGSFLCSIIRVTQDLIERRVWVHGDEQYRAYCARNLIPYALTHQKDNWSKHLSEKQTKKKSKSKGSMRDKKISKKRKRYDEDDRDDEDRRRKRVRNDRL